MVAGPTKASAFRFARLSRQPRHARQGSRRIGARWHWLAFMAAAALGAALVATGHLQGRSRGFSSVHIFTSAEGCRWAVVGCGYE